MSISEEYKLIYEKEIEKEVNKEIYIYDETEDVHSFRPLSHNCDNLCGSGCKHICHKSLGKLMRKNILFYCYGEEEVVNGFNNGLFDNFELATKSAYKLRLPKRLANQDGLPSEVLFDLLIQTLIPNSYKLAVRTIFRQDDNNEIKGYDLTYFTNENGKITLWLGQAKLGDKQYCRKGIIEDLVKKYDTLYLSKQIYFLADKPCGLSKEGKEIALLINKLNMINADQDDITRAEKLLEYLSNQNIDVNIPCLLAYGKNSVYKNISDLEKKIEKEIDWAKKYFNKIFKFTGIKPKLIFFILPIENLDELRGDDGFYAGLR